MNLGFAEKSLFALLRAFDRFAQVLNSIGAKVPETMLLFVDELSNFAEVYFRWLVAAAAGDCH
ncbi:hypothetical protein [Pseudomonas sp. 50_B]|uniref:hypothetical protein n=1 Tax=Pseudomonas sp. 50_B TaxID=2813574 RepID=UPI001A9F70BA|nr:hypothetical protein [Pseudomonas sp. 50_B]